MSRLAALALALALAAPSGGCKKQPQQRPVRQGRDEVAAPADPRLPAAHPLAREPDAGAFVEAPAALALAADAFVPAAPSLAEAAELLLRTQGPDDWAQATAQALDGQRPWAGAHVAGEDVVHLPLTKARVDQVQGLLARYPKRGDFGAVELPRAGLELRGGDLIPTAGKPPAASARLRFAWVDAAGATLTLADTPEGLATGRELPRTYGGRPLWFSLGEARGKELLGRFPYGRIQGGGAGLHSLDITAVARPGQPLPVLRDLAPGALTGALSKDLAVGATTRWTGYKDAVRDAIHEMQAQVDRAGFAGKMMLDPIADQATRVLKTWNGRVLVGVGPARHVRVALGAEDPHAAHRGLLTLVRDISDNLQLARMFVSNVPNVALKKVGDTPDVWLLSVSGITNQLPAEVRTLADDGRLRVAFSSSAHAGALLLVIGPRADAELKTWVAEANAGASGKDGMKDLASASLAAGPQALIPLLQAGDSPKKLLGAVLGLGADRAPTRVVLRQVDQRFEISVRGPEPKAKR